MNRRKFLKYQALLGTKLTLGTNNLVFGAKKRMNGLEEKHPDLTILNDRPINVETPAHLLNDLVTPADKFFVRNNGIPPIISSSVLKNWKLTVDGESAVSTHVFTLNELRQKFTQYSYYLTLECGGNGRSEFNPPAKGNQWTTGAVGCAKWTGVRLKDVLEYVGIKRDAKYIGYYGRDTHLSGDEKKIPISRGVPMEKAMEDESLIAWAMNDSDIPLLNGHPLRLTFGGWPASCSGKWLSRIALRNKEHDGPKMGGQSYRVPCDPVPPGTKVLDADMCIIESMPVKSLITYPKTGAILRINQSVRIEGHAWAGDRTVQSVLISADYGMSWSEASLSPPKNRLAWQRFTKTLSFESVGYYEVWAKAVDDQGISQPMILPGWNPRGYLNNACHRIALKVQ